MVGIRRLYEELLLSLSGTYGLPCGPPSLGEDLPPPPYPPSASIH